MLYAFAAGVAFGAAILAFGIWYADNHRRKAVPEEITEAERDIQLQWENLQRYEGKQQ